MTPTSVAATSAAVASAGSTVPRSPQAASPEYAVVERFARGVPNLILLTATPEQLGRSGHFARLRLQTAKQLGLVVRQRHQRDEFL